MILNYLKLSFRLMARNPFFTLINVTGLSLGFAVFFVLWQFSQSELNSDRQWKDWNRIALLGFFWEWSDDDGKTWDNRSFVTGPTSMSPKFVANYPELEEYTRIIYQQSFKPEYAGLTSRFILHVENPDGSKSYFKEENMACADPNLFTFFSIRVIEGNASTMLLKAHAIVLNQSSAKKLFGSGSPMGKIIFISNVPYEVAGVFEDLPNNTHLNFSMVISNQAQVKYWNLDHPIPPCFSYLKLKQPGDWQTFENTVNQPEALAKHWGEITRHFSTSRGLNRVIPLKEAPFTSSSDWTGNKSKSLLIAFQLIGVIVLILAVINYTMLNAARISSRLKEIATRKVSGAGERDFFKQFIVETIVIFSIAVLMAITIIQLSRVPLQHWLHISIYKISLESFFIFGITVAISVAICTAYPVVASRMFQPRVLLTKSRTRSSGRKFTLAILQYTCSIVLLVWSFLMYKQISFIINQNLGFGRANKIVVDGPVVRSDNYEIEVGSFANRITKIKGVSLATVSTASMGEYPYEMTARKVGSPQPVGLDTNGGVDENFVSLYELNIIAGRNFLPDDAANTIILSEGALSRLGFTDAQSAVGSRIEVLSSRLMAYDGEWINTEIIGVIKGYRVRPLFKYGGEFEKTDRGIGLTYKTKLVSLTPEKITLQVNTDNMTETMDQVRKEYEALFPGNIFNWRFLDENINQHYQSEEIWRNQVLVFTLIAIGVACLGLLGMISNKVVEKTKEIGIRKVLGAQLHQITHLLLNATLRQITLATVVGVPAAYYLTQQYLQKFSERIELQWWHFALPVALLIAIMLIVVAGIVWKAAVSNPVKSLKHD